MPDPVPDPADRASVAAFVRRVGAAVVATVDADGRPEAALVGITSTLSGSLVFDAFGDSRKVANLRTQDRIAVVVSRAQVSVQLEGRGRVVSGPERTAAEAIYLERFPEARIGDPELAVVVVEPDWVRTYDAGPSPAVVHAASWG